MNRERADTKQPEHMKAYWVQQLSQLQQCWGTFRATGDRMEATAAKGSGLASKGEIAWKRRRLEQVASGG